MNLTFGEQIKILLNRENKTIKDFAEQVEAATGVPCSRQNLTQKLKRDNFQEQDMRLLASILGYEVQITLIPATQEAAFAHAIPIRADFGQTDEFSEELTEYTPDSDPDKADEEPSVRDNSFVPDPFLLKAFLPKTAVQVQKEEAPVPSESTDIKDLPDDCINPETGLEYPTNTVRTHPTLDHYIQVYDQTEHIWTDVAEEYFLEFQEQKRQILGNDYIPPIYL